MTRLLLLLVLLLTAPSAYANMCPRTPNDFKQNILLTVLSGQEKTKVMETLSYAIDFSSIAERSLKNHWFSLPLAKKEEFKRTLKDLMVNNYANKFAGEIKSYSLTWSHKSSSTFSVLADVTQEDVDSTLEFFVSKTQLNCWKISDIIVDEVSVVDNYREQFTLIVVKHGFDHLLSRMKAKVKV